MTDTLFYTVHDSVIGRLVLVATHRGLRRIIRLEPGQDAPSQLAVLFSTPPQAKILEIDGFFNTTATAIDCYLAGYGELKLPFEITEGTALQRAVWMAISHVPYGKTISYTQLAERVGFPRAVRAVASACGANPLPLIIPCHRILAKDGTLGGFSLGGTSIKEQLLSIEMQKAGNVAA